MRIAEADITRDSAPFIIAEIGVNHDGSTATAIELVDQARNAGADAIKLQFYETDRLVSGAARLASYQRDAGESDAGAMLRRLEIGLADAAAIIAHARDAAIAPIVTIFSAEHAAPIAEMKPAALKSASPDVVNLPLLRAMEATGLPLIVSTGTATLDECRRCAEWLDAARNRLAMLHCVSIYPTPIERACLGGIAAMLQRLPGPMPVGYSDHTREEETGALAVALGARILEKHLTHDRAAPGPDHGASLEPEQFARYVSLARLAHQDPEMVARYGLNLDRAEMDPRVGPFEKQPSRPERDVRDASRQSVTSATRIARGEAITRSMLTIKRPGTGIEPRRLDEVAGRVAARDIEADRPICDDDLQ